MAAPTLDPLRRRSGLVATPYRIGLAALAASLALCTAPAGAATIGLEELPGYYVDDGHGGSTWIEESLAFYYRGEPGEVNEPSFRYAAESQGNGAMSIGDASADLTPGRGCERAADHPREVVCRSEPNTSWLYADLGDGDDRYVASDSDFWPFMVWGGAGDDVLLDDLTPEQADFRGQLHGDEGADVITTTRYMRLEGGAGDDRLSGGNPSCGGQFVPDMYSWCAQLPGQRGYLPDDGDDLLLGTDRSEGLFGGTGDDHVVAGAGGDIIWTGPGDDVIDATGDAPGPRYPSASEQPDPSLPYQDDEIDAGDGNDHIDARDGAFDLIQCAEGEADTALRDATDYAFQTHANPIGPTWGCEQLDPPEPISAYTAPPDPPVGPFHPPGPRSGEPSPESGALRLGRPAIVTREGILVLRAVCESQVCRASISVRGTESGTRAARKLAGITVVLSHESTKVGLRPNAKTRRALVRGRLKRVTATVRQPRRAARKVVLHLGHRSTR